MSLYSAAFHCIYSDAELQIRAYHCNARNFAAVLSINSLHVRHRLIYFSSNVAYRSIVCLERCAAVSEKHYQFKSHHHRERVTKCRWVGKRESEMEVCRSQNYLMQRMATF